MDSPRVSLEQIARIEGILGPVEPRVLYVFGSAGTERAHPGSDLDLAVLPGRPLDPATCFEFANRLSEALGIQVELVDLTPASDVMRKEVLRTGERLSVPDRRAAEEFEMQTLANYARLNEERAVVLGR